MSKASGRLYPTFDAAEAVVPLYDALRENRIGALKRLLAAAIRAGHKEEAYRIRAEFLAALEARSPEQVARMEDAEMERVPEIGSSPLRVG